MNRCCFRTIITWIVFCAVSLSCASACTYGAEPPSATIGKPMNLSCTIKCVTQKYKWYRIHLNGTKTTVGSESTLVVSDNVTSAAEVGGQLYQCYCSSGVQCKLFRIGVKPVAHLHILNNVTKSGSAVNIICTAESYPPAENISNYQMRHPKDRNISIETLPEKNGVIHKITAASKKKDAGEYECTVSITMEEYPGISLQSKINVAHLTIYDAPTISSIRNSTVYCIQESTILECTIDNSEKGLKVWTTWTEYNGGPIKTEHVVLQKSDASFLLLYNASANNYMCQIFSSYSPDKPEDQRVVAVVFQENYSPTAEGLTQETDGCNGTGVISGVSTAFAVTVIIVIIFFVFLLYRKKNCNPNHSKLDNDDGEESKNDSTEIREATPEASNMQEEMTDYADTPPKRHSSLKRFTAIPKEEIKPLIPTNMKEKSDVSAKKEVMSRGSSRRTSSEPLPSSLTSAVQ